MVNVNRLRDNLQRLAKIGSQDGKGITRLAFSDADWEARQYVIEIMKNAGLSLRIDEFGNLIGRREGQDPHAAAVMMGSHIDSVPEGGNFDGIVGVLGAIEVIRCLNEEQIATYHPIEVVVFMAEESSRFGVATLGSKVLCGKIGFSDIEKLVDKEGISLPEAMRVHGLFPERVGEAYYRGEVKSFLELHIEQGKVLETTGNTIGVVTGIVAPTRLRAIITGQADHSGATPMNMRQDALAAAAEIILGVERLANDLAEQGMVGTTGVIQASPGVMNVIPGRVELGIDIRGISPKCKERMLCELMEAIDKVRARRSVAIEVTMLANEQPVHMSGQMIEFLSGLCKEESYAFRQMTSGAGHDAMHMAAMAPTGILFIPCKAGISHNPAEWAEVSDIAIGTKLLLVAVQRIVQKDFIWKTS